MDWTAEDVITTDRYLAAFPNNYYKTDVFYFNPVLWRGRNVYPPSPWKFLFIVGHSDYPITEAIVNRYPTVKWFCVNTQTSKAKGIPLGIANDCDDHPHHRICGNIPMMIEIASQPRTIVNLLYLNFSTWTYASERQPILEKYRNQPWTTYEETIVSIEGRKQYLQSIRNHRFVACPRGNGVDTHRLWETLYMGSIPIVKKDIAHSNWLDLPILWIDDWNQLSEEYLIEQEKVIQSKEWNREKLKVGYWINYISNN
jgi:hypothetical protein